MAIRFLRNRSSKKVIALDSVSDASAITQATAAKPYRASNWEDVSPDTDNSFVGDVDVDGKVFAVDGIGVGNSAAAATPDTVVKKIEVFDEAGASLGFIAVYDAIT